MQERFIIYDMQEQKEGLFLNPKEGDALFAAAPAVKHCIGCFGCWIKEPGRCVIKDRADEVIPRMVKCRELILVSPILYGGYSQNIKAVLERCIGYILPYFRIANGRMRHKLRYKNPFSLGVYFYGECDEDEKDIAERLVKANAINLGIENYSVHFCKNAKEAEREIL